MLIQGWNKLMYVGYNNLIYVSSLIIILRKIQRKLTLSINKLEYYIKFEK